jgi:hypothetical protein
MGGGVHAGALGGAAADTMAPNRTLEHVPAPASAWWGEGAGETTTTHA